MYSPLKWIRFDSDHSTKACHSPSYGTGSLIDRLIASKQQTSSTLLPQSIGGIDRQMDGHPTITQMLSAYCTADVNKP